MVKRIYWETVKKWAINVGVVGGTLIGLFFAYLITIGAISNVSYSGDMVCAGTSDNPCYAYINFTANEDIFMYKTDYDPWGRDTIFNFDPGVKSWAIERSWGDGWREINLHDGCTGSWCGCSWCTKENPGEFAYAFRKGRDYQIRITGYKNSPYDTIKWGAFSGVDEIDPNWYGIDRDIGYEFINDSVVHIWNTQDDYFFEKDAGIQLTNHYEDYWTRNIFCLGYYDGDEWNKIKCADELTNFNKNIQTDNETYVNATLWKDISYGNYDLRLGIRYHLGLDDKNLSITIYGKNLGEDIPFDLGFAWKVKDLDVPSNKTNDKILINNTNYELDEEIDLLFKNMTRKITHTNWNETCLEECEIMDFECQNLCIVNQTYSYEFLPFYKIYDKDSEGLLSKENFLRIDWNKDLPYAVKIHTEKEQINSYVMFLVNAGHFNPNQSKATTFYWIDALIDDLQAYYKLDEASGNVVDTHNSNDLTAVGTCTYGETGKIGDAIKAVGSGTPSVTNKFEGAIADMNTDYMSYSFWFKKVVGTSGFFMFIGNDEPQSSLAGGRVYVDTDNIVIQVSDSAYGPNTVYDWTEDTNWHHVVATFSETTMKLYFDGVYRATAEWDGRSLIENTDWGIFGCPSSYGTVSGTYIMDEVAIFSKTLSDGGIAIDETAGGEIEEIYNSGSGLSYPFEEEESPFNVSQISDNSSVTYPKIGTYVSHKAYWQTNVTLSSYIFSWNDSGSWANESIVLFSGNNNWSNVTTNVTASKNTIIGWRIYANDSESKWNNTGINIYTVRNWIPENPTNPIFNDSTLDINESVNLNVTIQDHDGLSDIDKVIATIQHPIEILSSTNNTPLDYDYSGSNPIIPNLTGQDFCNGEEFGLELSSIYEDGVIHTWYRVWCNGMDMWIVYSNSTDGINFSDPVNISLEGGNMKRGLHYVHKVNSTYYMFVPNLTSAESSVDLLVYSSTDKINWLQNCSGSEITSGGYKKNPAVWYNETDGVWHGLFEEGYGIFNIFYWNSTDLCSGWTKYSNPFGDNAGNADIKYMNNEFIVYYGDMSEGSTPMNISVARGDRLDNLQMMDKFVIGYHEAWESNHVSNPDVVIIDDENASYNYKYYIYYSGDDERTGVAFDSAGRTFNEAHFGRRYYEENITLSQVGSSQIWSGDFSNTSIEGTYNVTKVWVNDTDGTVGSEEFNTISFLVSTADTTEPTYSNAQTNTTIAGETILFSILYDDDTALEPNGQYIFSTNNTGEWVNDSAVNFTSTPEWANVTKTLNTTVDTVIGYRWYANDSAGNVNNTGIFTLTTISADTCTYTSGNWAVDCSDNCVIDENVNLGGNNISLSGSGIFVVEADITNYDKLFLYDTCEIRVYDGGSL